MPAPEVLVIELQAEGAFLYRFTRDDRCAGDTWHPTIEEAKRQAQFEYDVTSSEWITVPADVRDAFAFALDAFFRAS